MWPQETGVSKRRAHKAEARFSRLLPAVVMCGLFSAISGAAPANAVAFDLASHRGRVVIVDFWASWCKPCRQSIPWLNYLRAQYGASGLVIIGVNVDAERRDAEKFLDEVPIEFEVVFDPAGELAKKFDLQGMPSTFVYDRNGALAETHLGFRDSLKSQREAALKNLLNQPTK